jgi:hypothetical protein
MSEQWTRAFVFGASPESLLPLLREASLPVAIRVARAPGGTTLLFEGLGSELGRFLLRLPWLTWVETEDSIAPARRLTLLRGGRTVYEESLDPEGRLHVLHAGERRSCPAERITPRVAAHARAAIEALSAAGIQPLPVRRIWEGDPFPDSGPLEAPAIVPASRSDEEEEGEIPF